ncbi:hypothetical protein ABIB44_000365 [Hymenobacter sp. UYCo722]
MRFSIVCKLLLALQISHGATVLAGVLPTAAPLPFVANRGQWEPRIRYAVGIPGGKLYLEGNCFTYHLFAESPACPTAGEPQAAVASHAFRVTLVGAAAAAAITGEEIQQTYHNYFLGNKPERWAARVPLFAGVRYHNAYPGVDMRWHQQGANQLEYDFELAPGVRPAVIRLRYDGLDGLALTPEGHLQLRTSVGQLREQAPVAWQLAANGARRSVPCRFVLHGREVGFALGAGYDPTQRLVIDPVLVFATYSGSPGGASANTTVADAQGNMYTGSYVLGSGYPVTVGAIKATYRYGNMGISKFSASGNSLLYATYLGGSGGGEEYPLDVEINAAGELLILGSSSSFDYPITAGAYDRTLGSGGGSFSPRDLVVTRLNPTGTALVASTYLGGSLEETGPVSSVPAGLAVDPNGDVLVVSSTYSTDFPTLNPQQSAAGGGQDGIVTRFNPTLTALRWSTYLGGNGDDRVHDVKVAPNGDVYVCGATSSNNLPVGTGGLLPTAPVGTGRNGFVLRYSAAGVRLAGTYLGTSSDDIARFLDFDAAGNVLVAGASEGTYPRSAGTFGAVVPFTSGVFIHSLTPSLNTIFSTQISVLGQGQLSRSNSSNIVTAFGRDDCGRLYFSAYAGAIGNVGCPLTPDAQFTQPRTLYLATLAENATSLLYGTYVGEPNNSSSPSFSTHLHYAAANQITRSGVLYHLTCSIGRAFPTTPGAYSAGLTGGNDGAAFKYNMQPLGNSAIQLQVPVPAAGCAPYTVQFVNTTVSKLAYSWDFGDGSPLDTAKAPSHKYVRAGTYSARLVATRSIIGCGPASVALVVPVVVVAPAPVRIAPDSLGCGRTLVLDPARLQPSVTGRAYAWSTGAQTATLGVSAAGRYRVEIDQGAPCPTTIEFVVKEIAPEPVRIVRDSLGCGNLLVLDPSLLKPRPVGTVYRWNTGAQTPTLAITTPGRYRLEIEQGRFCPVVVEYDIRLSHPFPLPNILTANGDKQNALFKIPASYGTPALKVYNRWGRLVYESAAYGGDWDGAGHPAGVYYYLLTQPACGINLKGWVEIMR